MQKKQRQKKKEKSMIMEKNQRRGRSNVGISIPKLKKVWNQRKRNEQVLKTSITGFKPLLISTVNSITNFI